MSKHENRAEIAGDGPEIAFLEGVIKLIEAHWEFYRRRGQETRERGMQIASDLLWAGSEVMDENGPAIALGLGLPPPDQLRHRLMFHLLSLHGAAAASEYARQRGVTGMDIAADAAGRLSIGPKDPAELRRLAAETGTDAKALEAELVTHAAEQLIARGVAYRHEDGSLRLVGERQ
jgi:hypothetical protein